MAATASPSHKGVKTAIILIPSEIWKERNGRIFNNKSSMSSLLFQGIKDKAKVGSSLELRNWEKVSNAFFSDVVYACSFIPGWLSIFYFELGSIFCVVDMNHVSCHSVNVHL